MSDDQTDYDHVKVFLKKRYPGDRAYEAIFANIVNLNELFEFIHGEMPTFFARLDQDCEAFQRLACMVISIQQENREYYKSMGE